MICCAGFPFIGASNRSLFTKFVDSKPSLQSRHAVMQAVLSMAASVAGFVTPGFVAKYVLRHPEEVDASSEHRELNPMALYTVVCPMLSIVGIVYVTFCKPVGKTVSATPGEDALVGECSPLTGRASGSIASASASHSLSTSIQQRRSSISILEQKVDPTTTANRCNSAQLMGLSQFDTPDECQRRSIISAELAAEFCEDADI
jgi:hypothetical protein